jgi:drug/metabolite transporter (DMT)-like permease
MKPLLWIAVALMLVGAVMLVAGIAASGPWIAVITVGIALVVVAGCAWARRRGSDTFPTPTRIPRTNLHALLVTAMAVRR